MHNQPEETRDVLSSTLPPMRVIHAPEVIIRCGSVATAADETGISSGAVSQQLREIEREINL